MNKCPSDSVEAPNLRFNGEDEELPFSEAKSQEQGKYEAREAYRYFGISKAPAFR